MPLIQPEDWRPVGISEMEPNAWKAIKHPSCACVVAGPGAGKTEFLAQRATFLLQTGLCHHPFRILAVCFKRDAAQNLAQRIAKRCSPEQARRFRSQTFDSLTKGILDRFLDLLPVRLQFSHPYEIYFPRRTEFEAFLEGALRSCPHGWQNEIAKVKADQLEKVILGSYRLEPEERAPTTAIEFLASRWWADTFRPKEENRLSFLHINRLAELLLRTNDQLKTAFRWSYPFVFLDEFQDVTYAQYDFLCTAFHSTDVTVTAVGDDKQKIMLWAGALKDAFTAVITDFKAQRFPLEMNHRSSPELVRIQHYIAKKLDPDVGPSLAQAPQKIDTCVTKIFRYSSQSRESQHIAEWISHDMKERGLQPRDYVIIVRQKPENYESDFIQPFQSQNLQIRNESKLIGKTTLQDLLAEQFTRICIDLFDVVINRDAARAWISLRDLFLTLHSIEPEDEVGSLAAEARLGSFIASLKQIVSNEKPSIAIIENILDLAYAFLDLRLISYSFAEYSTTDALEIASNDFREYAKLTVSNADSWMIFFESLIGRHQVPIMTIHKSKGLEYDTVLFMGLDDSSWWSHRPNDVESLATFFVAFSRAKQRVIFTYCTARGSRDKVSDLYRLLQDAGVDEEKVDCS